MVAPPWSAAAVKPSMQAHHEFSMVNPINRNDASARPILCASRLRHVEMRARICQSAPIGEGYSEGRMKRPRAAVPTRDRILDEVERLIAIKGVYGFKLRDVAERLELKHYQSRDDVLVEVSRRFVSLLGAQFDTSGTRRPVEALRANLNRFVEFKMFHPAYVRLALVDFATPDGGMEYVKRAAGGSFEDNFSAGPLAAMHARLRALLKAGVGSRHFRRVDATDFYRVVKSALLIRLVFPNDELLLRRPTPAEVRSIQRWLWDLASGFLARRSASSR
jgi:AcrR family transcriptional regulator